MKKNIAIGVAIVVVVLAVILGLKGCGAKEEDAIRYVQAQLDLMFQGETQEAQNATGGTRTELEQVYEDGIHAFVVDYLTGGVDTQNAFTSTYGELVKQIFTGMRYQVLEDVVRDKDGYKVTVKYQPANVFTNFLPELEAEASRIEEKAQGGGYEGNEEEVQAAMVKDYMSNSFMLLESAYLDMEYGKNEEFTFTVTRGKGSSVTMDHEEIGVFMEKILALDKL